MAILVVTMTTKDQIIKTTPIPIIMKRCKEGRKKRIEKTVTRKLVLKKSNTVLSVVLFIGKYLSLLPIKTFDSYHGVTAEL